MDRDRRMNSSNHVLVFVAFLSLITNALCVDPLSKIVITSTNATCAKDSTNKGFFVFNYNDNVRVEFADKSTVTADSLEVVIDASRVDKSHDTKRVKEQTQKKPALESFKHITFKNHVCVMSAQRKATADVAHFYLQDQRCLLEGNVNIWQQKQKTNDIPLTIQSQKAELNLRTGQARFVGTSIQPVSTTIVLEGYPALQHKKKIKKKHHHGKNKSSSSSRGS